MIIIVDKEGREQVRALCDCALRAGGLKNMRQVVDILNNMKAYKGPEAYEEPEKGDN